MNKERQSHASDLPKVEVATFTLVYESKDGRLCLFEDAEGHLTVVRAEKLA